ncbi:hypothetical protein IQ07DRAFT_397216 [Pyrenochaeta sp. DS3sAY3a]|nr:hypothetical protein IQ07DRAFT_397216 [Pyrenochaeta sp. DS3sAY3a]
MRRRHSRSSRVCWVAGNHFIGVYFSVLNGDSQANNVQRCKRRCGEAGSQGCEKARAVEPIVLHVRQLRLQLHRKGGQQDAAWLRSDSHRSISRLCACTCGKRQALRDDRRTRIVIGVRLWCSVPLLILHEVLPTRRLEPRNWSNITENALSPSSGIMDKEKSPSQMLPCRSAALVLMRA